MFPLCEVCGTATGLADILHCFRRRGQLSYPFRRHDGERHEEPIKWICHRCRRRAIRRRDQLIQRQMEEVAGGDEEISSAEEAAGLTG